MKQISRKKRGSEFASLVSSAELRKVLREFRMEVSVSVEFLRIYSGGAESTTFSVPVASLQDAVCKLLLPPLGKYCGFYFPVFGPGIVDDSLVKPQLNSTFCKETQLVPR